MMPVWRQGITGRGVVVSILDDGVDHTHPDLRDNFVSQFSYKTIESNNKYYVSMERKKKLK